MITIFYRAGNTIVNEIDEDLLPSLAHENLLWVDLVDPTFEQRDIVESYFNISLQTPQQVEEIESSSRYSETERLIIANSNFLMHRGDEYVSEPTSFILTDGVLVTQRNEELRSFGDTMRKLSYNAKAYSSGYHIMVALFETRIDLDADMVENLARDITGLSRRINLAKGNELEGDLLLDLNAIQENTMLIRENIVDKQRVISSVLKSERFPKELSTKLEVMLRDTNSLINHADFSFDRIDFQRETFMGLANLQLSRITKTYTIVSVLFMPPTLVASIYGMNFLIMPETQWKLGYPLAIVIMILSALITFIIFRIKKLI